MDSCFNSQLALRYQLPTRCHVLNHSLVPDSDSLYHRLFSHPRMVEELVREFVPEALAGGLDFSGLQRVNPKFHSGRRVGRRRESDVMIALAPDSPLWPWQPRVRYYLLDMGAFPKDDLARRMSVAALLFRLEQPPSSEEIEELVGEVVGWFRQHPDYADLRRLFTELVRRAFIELGETGYIPEDLLEMKTNLEGLGKTWKRQWLAQGKAEGKLEGKAEALVCLLAKRFGTVTPSLREKIGGANLTTLEYWFERAVAAPDLLSVFAQPR